MRISSLPLMLVLATTSPSPAQTETSAPAAPSVPTRAELRDRQLDATLEARDIERVLTRLKRASDLSRERMTAAAAVAEAAAAAIERGDSKSAEAATRQAAEMFREIARQLEALLQEDTPQRVAAARNLANRLATLERKFAEQFPGMLNAARNASAGTVNPKSQERPRGSGASPPPGAAENPTDKGKSDKPGESRPGGGQTGSDQKPEQTVGGSGGTRQEADRTRPAAGSAQADDDRREALAEEAANLAETGRTLQDVLKSLAESTEPGDQETAGKIAELLKETQLNEMVAAMQQAPGRIRNGELEQVRLAALDAADRLEITEQRLDATFQAIVAPRVETLMREERKLADLRNRQSELKTPSEVVAWHREVDQLLQRLDELGVSSKLSEAIRDELRQAGWGRPGFQRAVRAWALVDDRYVLPGSYDRILVTLQDELQTRIQNLVLADLSSVADEATPPMYQDLVERYLKVLSQERGSPTR